MKECKFYIKLENNKVQCCLCPHQCIIPNEQTGFCKVRKNINGSLHLLTYGVASSIAIDPIEKKPFYHFHTGERVLSIGSFGCNMRCSFCQNHEISQNVILDKNLSPEEFKNILEKHQGEYEGVAFTYNEPSIWYEYMIDLAKISKEKGYYNTMITNGYINPEPLKELSEYIDAFSVDIKSFNEDFYKKITFSQLKPVLNSLLVMRELKKHIEIEFLVIPTLNDNQWEIEEMGKWIKENLDEETPLHINRYHPAYQCSIPQTPIETLDNFEKIAKKYLKNVYIGNIPGQYKPQVHKNFAEGRFYPKEKEKLNLLIEEIYKCEEDKIQKNLNELFQNEDLDIIGGIVPHAGYVYSGYEAIHFFKILEESYKKYNLKYDTVIILNPNHTGIGGAASPTGADVWKTSLGQCQVDKEFLKSLNLKVDERAHINEHSGEVILPFLQKYLPYEFKILPITIGAPNPNVAKELATRIFETKLKLKKNILIIASSDFSHYVTREVGQKLDNVVLDRIEKKDSEGVFKEIQKNNISICGYGPIMTLMEYSNFLGDYQLKLLRKGDSGEVNNSKEVVNYNTFLFFK